MQEQIIAPQAPCAVLREGVSALASAAAAVYGTQKKVQFRQKDGGYGSVCAFSALLEQAAFAEEPTARAAALLEESGLPQDGAKTVLLLLDALLTYGTQAGCTEEDWRQVGEVLDYGARLMPKLAAEHDGKVIGGGLALLTLCRPFRKYGRDHGCGRAAAVAAYAMEQPLLKLSAAAGVNGHQVYERVKALAPNQFFSLNQVGIERSIQTTVNHMDVIQMGLDLRIGTVRDLLEAGVLQDPEELQAVLGSAKTALEKILDIAALL